jgi:hypothetical protein
MIARVFIGIPAAFQAVSARFPSWLRAVFAIRALCCQRVAASARCCASSLRILFAGFAVATPRRQTTGDPRSTADDSGYALRHIQSARPC